MRLLNYTIVFLGIALALLVLADFQLRSGSAEIVFLDIGQGDAILVQRGTTQVLIDGGPDAEVIDKLGKYMPFWDRTIELVVLSHAHSDHYLGLIDVFDRFRVDKFIWNGAEEEAADFAVMLDMLEAENCPTELATADRDFRLGAVYFDVLFPWEADQFLDQAEDNLNNTSIIIRAMSPQKTILLTGDAEEDVEEKLIAEHVFVQADILKAGHHGSKTSSSEAFVKRVSPSRATFHAGEDNKFNHPSDEVVSRYQALGVDTFTLWQTGDIREEL